MSIVTASSARTSLHKGASLHERTSLNERASLNERTSHNERTSLHDRTSLNERTSLHERTSFHQGASLHESTSLHERTSFHERTSLDEQKSLNEQNAFNARHSASERKSIGSRQSLSVRHSSSVESSPHTRSFLNVRNSLEHAPGSLWSDLGLGPTEEIPGFFGQIITPSHPEYSIAISRWAFNAQRPARLVVYPRFITDIFLAISHSHQHALPLAVRGGGHSCAGTSSSADGLVIDLSRHFAHVRIDIENRIAFVGGGAVWRKVDEAAIKYGLAAVGGTVNHTGVGGLTLGGGYGWLTGQYGLACDNVIAATVVTPGTVDEKGQLNPTSRTVSAVADPDLFFAIRGGGGNFGVVTEFAIRLHVQRRRVWSGTIIYGSDALEEVFMALDEWWNDAGEGRRPGEAALTFFFVDPTTNEACIGLRPFYNGSADEGRGRFARFFEIHHLADQTRELPYELMNAQQNEQALPGDNMYMTGTSRTHFSPDVARILFTTFAEIAIPPYTASAVIVEYLPLHLVRVYPSDLSSFPGRTKGDNIVFLIHWPREHKIGNLDAARAHATRLKEVIWENERTLGGEADSAGYANYQSETADHHDSASLYGALYPRLQMVKATHDPHGLFDKFYPIQPSLENHAE